MPPTPCQEICAVDHTACVGNCRRKQARLTSSSELPTYTVPTEEVAFENGVFLLTKAKAEELRQRPIEIAPTPPTVTDDEQNGGTERQGEIETTSEPDPETPIIIQPDRKASLSLSGTLPRESWNRVGTRLLPKLQGSEDISLKIELSASVGVEQAENMATELRQALEDLGLNWQVNISGA